MQDGSALSGLEVQYLVSESYRYLCSIKRQFRVLIAGREQVLEKLKVKDTAIHVSSTGDRTLDVD